MFKITAYLLLISLILLSLTGAKTIHSQEFTFEKAHQDYVYTQTKYNQAYSEYDKAKAFYLKNKTLTLKEEARVKTLAMLRERDELIRVYVTALRMKLFETEGLTPGEKGTIFAKIDPEVTWFRAHKDAYQESDPLETLFTKSAEAENRYKTSALVVIYDSLFNVTLGEVAGLRLDHEEIYSATRGTLDTVDPFTRWITDIDLVIQNLKGNEDKAKKEIAKLYLERYKAPLSVYNTAVEPFVSSTTFLSQLNSFLVEFLTSINNQL